MITFRFRPVKVIEAISWMLRTAKTDPTDPAEQLDLHKILKTCYFADKRALNEIGRPVFGARYTALELGPVPVEIAEMLRCDPIWLAELAGDGLTDYPWETEGCRVFLRPGHDGHEDCGSIAPVDMPLIEEEFARCRRTVFTQQTHETHALDWVMGFERPGRSMDWEDMILETHPDREAMIADLRENAPYFAL